MQYKIFNKKMIFQIMVIAVLFGISPESIQAYDFPKNNTATPFLAQTVEPSVLISCDTSGSMDRLTRSGAYSAEKVYYGYFDPYSYYRYVKCEDTAAAVTTHKSGYFEAKIDFADSTTYWKDSLGNYHRKWGVRAAGEADDANDNIAKVLAADDDDTGVGNHEWSGNYLNYMTMRRTDVLKKVLIGGRRAPDYFGDLLDNVPDGHNDGGDAGFNFLDFLFVGDNKYYTSGVMTISDAKLPLPPGPGPEAEETAKPDRTDTSNNHFGTPYGTGAGPTDVGYSMFEDSDYSQSNGQNNIHPFFIQFGSVANTDHQRKLLAIRLPVTSVGKTIQPQGVVQKTSSQVRYGVMRFNTDNHGGQVIKRVGDIDHLCIPISGCSDVCDPYGNGSDSLGDGFRMAGVIKAINDLEANGNTPVGESLLTAALYFAQADPKYHTTDYITNQIKWDPFFFNKDINKNCSLGDNEGEYSVCSQGTIILLTDGEPTSDFDAGGGDEDVSDLRAGTPYNLSGAAGFAHLTDHRTGTTTHDSVDYDFDAMRHFLDVYSVFTFGSGSAALQAAAKWGGFTESTPTGDPMVNWIPDVQSEYDTPDDADVLPDNYFHAENGQDIENALVSILADIMKKAASGTAASVVAGSREGAGAVYQALFFPEMKETGSLNKISWGGYLHALFIDDYGNLCEDNSSPYGQLDPNDRIVRLYWNDVDNVTKVRFYQRGPDGTLGALVDVGDNEISDITPIWEAGTKLSQITDTDILTQRAYGSAVNQRYLFTWIDNVDETNDFNGKVDANEQIAFTLANKDFIKPYFDLPALADPDYITPENLITWIRGTDVATHRSRQIDFDGDDTQETWRLGDIIYSTPTVVGRPAEALDLIYSDASYREFYDAQRNRRHVVYVGGNDGMLHAFNGGFFNEGSYAYTEASADAPTKTAYGLGQELWAYIPYNLLPHLQALPQTNYGPEYGNHVAFVDLKPRIMDVRFADNTWHTVLVCGMRLGGGEVKLTVSDNDPTPTDKDVTLKSAYFALDITNPEVPPELLWSFNDTIGTTPPSGIGGNHLGFTTGYPAVVNQYDTSLSTASKIKTWVIVGSGLTTINRNYSTAVSTKTQLDYPMKSNQQGRLYAVDIETGKADLIPIEQTPGGTTQLYLSEANSYFGDPVAIDLNVGDTEGGHYASELAYVGMSHYDSTAEKSKGKVYRVATMTSAGESEIDPSDWVASLLIDVGQPVVAAPNVSAAGRFSQAHKYRAYIDSTDADSDSSVPMVYFGTGELWFPEDKKDQSQQTFYGIIEPLKVESADERYEYEGLFGGADGFVSVANLMDTTETDVYENGFVDMDGDGAFNQWSAIPTDVEPDFTTWGEDPADFYDWIEYLTIIDYDEVASLHYDHFSRYQGWKMDLYTSPDGERVLGQCSVIGQVVLFSSYTPSEELCNASGSSQLYGVHFMTGSAVPESILGLGAKTITVTETSGDVTYSDSIRALDLGAGMALSPTLHADKQGNLRVITQTSSGTIIETTAEPLTELDPAGVHIKSWREMF